jgi:hypothetical protein
VASTTINSSTRPRRRGCSRLHRRPQLRIGLRYAAVSSAFAGATASPKARASAQPAQAAPAGRKGRKLNLSPKVIAVRKLQGKYLGSMRALQATGRKRVSKVAREQGVAAAIRFAATIR